MLPEPVLLALPTQSVAVRLLVAAVVAGVLVRLLLRMGLRAPRLRVAASQIPGLVLVAVVALSLGTLRLPSIVRAFDGTLPSSSSSYEVLIEFALPALLATWLVVVVTRVGWRAASLVRLHRSARRAVVATEVPIRVRRLTVRLAAELGIDAPRLGLRSGLQGGAAVVGIRRPVVLVDGDLAARLDDEELEGVLAHEFSHIARRDNLVALLLCLVGDLTFFVPGGRWSRRRLLIERELATDEQAVEVTGRPGALASGLLKVVEGASAPAACAAFMPQGTLVTRIEHLVDTRPAPSRLRLAAEGLAVLAALAVCVVAATAVPRAVAGSQPDSGIGLALGAPITPALSEAGDVETPMDDGAVFEVYDLTNLSSTAPDLTPGPVRVDDDREPLRPELLLACATGDTRCERPAVAPALPLRPQVLVEPDENLVRWRLRPMVETGNGIGLYFLSRTG